MAATESPNRAYALAIETSSAIGSAALGCGAHVLESRSLSGPRRHAVEFVSTLAELCDTHSVTAAGVRSVYVSSGPGSFTGLRIGMTAARMIGLATVARCVTVPTLEVIAQNALDAKRQPEYVAVLLDAKRGRVYAAAFALRGGEYIATGEPVEADPAEFLCTCRKESADCAVLGEGVAYHRQAVSACGLLILPETFNPPRAETVYRLGHALECEGRLTDRRTLTPTYIRPPEAEENWQRRHGKEA